MTKVALKGPVNGTGSYTLSAPETADTLELELPTTGTHLAGANASGMPLGPGGDPVVESGSNSDGDWTRWADGTQICGASVTLTSSNLAVLDATWNFPAPFSNGMRPLAQPDSVNLSANTAPNLHEIGLLSSQAVSTSNCTFQLRRIEGMTNFVAGDSGVIRPICFGYWK